MPMLPIPNSIAAMADELTEWRRDLHHNPELSQQETRTARIVAEKLRHWGFDAVEEGVGKTGVVGVLHGRNGPGEAILLRADMDALPMQEESGLEHASATPGVMHACGHDGHTTMLLGAARHLSETRNFDGTVYFCFQPAEEDGTGAKAMIDDGLFDRYPARAVYGMHNWPGMPVGTFGVRPGPVMAAAGIFDIRVRGRGGHGAIPHLARDPIAAGAQIVTALQTIVSRKIDPVQPAVVSVTQFQSGTTFNVIPDEAKICGTVRAFDDDVTRQIGEEMHRVCEKVALAMDVEVRFEIEPECHPATVNDPREAAFAAEVLDGMVGPEDVARDVPPTMGAEDFAYLSQARPGAFIFIGNGDSAPLHNVAYDFNDEATPIGAAFWSRLVETALPQR
jgi:hippurate hydrolase